MEWIEIIKNWSTHSLKCESRRIFFLKIMINWPLFDEINQLSTIRKRQIGHFRLNWDGITKIKLKSVNSTQKRIENIKIIHSPLSLICAMGQKGRSHQLCPMALDKQPPKTASFHPIHLFSPKPAPTDSSTPSSTINNVPLPELGYFPKSRNQPIFFPPSIHFLRSFFSPK